VHGQRDREAHPGQPCQLPGHEPHAPNVRFGCRPIDRWPRGTDPHVLLQPGRVARHGDVQPPARGVARATGAAGPPSVRLGRGGCDVHIM
jgi:hypothetical protein